MVKKMPKAITDGKTQIGACRIPGRKKICLCIESGTCLTVYGYFQSEQKADEFMQKLGRLVGAMEEGEEHAPD